MARSRVNAIFMKVLDLLKYGFSINEDGTITAPPGVAHGACGNCTKTAADSGEPCPCVLPEPLELLRAPRNISRDAAAASNGLYMRRACERCAGLKIACDAATSGEGSSFYWKQRAKSARGVFLSKAPKPEWRVARAAAAKEARKRRKEKAAMAAAAAAAKARQTARKKAPPKASTRRQPAPHTAEPPSVPAAVPATTSGRSVLVPPPANTAVNSVAPPPRARPTFTDAPLTISFLEADGWTLRLGEI